MRRVEEFLAARGRKLAVDGQVLVQGRRSSGRADAGQQTRRSRPDELGGARSPHCRHSEEVPSPWTEPVKVLVEPSRFKTIVRRSCAPDAFLRSATSWLPCRATILPE